MFSLKNCTQKLRVGQLRCDRANPTARARDDARSECGFARTRKGVHESRPLRVIKHCKP